MNHCTNANPISYVCHEQSHTSVPSKFLIATATSSIEPPNHWTTMTIHPMHLQIHITTSPPTLLQSHLCQALPTDDTITITIEEGHTDLMDPTTANEATTSVNLDFTPQTSKRTLIAPIPTTTSNQSHQTLLHLP